MKDSATTIPPMSQNEFLHALAARIGASTATPVLAVAKASPAKETDRGGYDYLRLAEAARLACVSIPTLKSWEGRGLKIRRPSPGVVLVKKSDLVRFIEGDGEGR